MKPLLFLANVFINTFGITQPSPQAAEKVARRLAIMMLGVIVTVVLVGIFVFHVLYHQPATIGH